MHLILLISGSILLALAWGTLPRLAQDAFFIHMIMHMTVVAIAAPLLALGLARSEFDPVRRWPWLFAPIPLSIIELVVVWGWHTPGLHHAARHSLGGLIAEQGMFLTCGLLVWISALGGGALRGNNRTAAGITALLLTSMHMTLLGALLALTPRPLYTHHHVAENIAGLSPVADQHLGGAIMLILGAASYLVGGVALTAALFRGRSQTSPLLTR